MMIGADSDQELIRDLSHRVVTLDRENAEIRGKLRLLAAGLISANRDNYPWKAGSVASRALDEAERVLRRKKA